MTEQSQRHPLMVEMMDTHQDVRLLHPLLSLLDQPEGGEDPLMILVNLVAKIEVRLAAIEAALSLPHLSEPVEL